MTKAATKTTETKRRRAARSVASEAERALQIDPGAVRDIAARLARVEGQVRAVQRMLNERRDCHAIVQQLAAARTALERATAQLMVSSLAQCIRESKGSTDDDEIQRLMATFTKLL